MHNQAEAKRILEAVLLASQEPLGVAELRRLFDDAVSPETLRHLLTDLREEWHGHAVGQRETPGRPALYATTRKFLDDLGLRTMEELPPLEEIAKTVQLERPAVTDAGQRAANSEPEEAATGTDG